MSPAKSFYLPALDGLRFVAFFMVFLHHMKVVGDHFGFPAILYLFLLKCNQYGWMGVDLFLTLSSFLLSRLLFLEWKSRGNISVLNFYVRRSLRIWPLYYFMCLLGFAILPYLNFSAPPLGTLAYQQLVDRYFLPFVFFFANWATAHYGYASEGALSLLWTISLEEQFYLVWPWALFFIRCDKRSILKLAFIMLVFTACFRGWALWEGWPHPGIWVTFFSRLDAFALGGTLAFFYDDLQEKFGKIPAWAWGTTGFMILAGLTFTPNIDQGSLNVLWQYEATALGSCLLIIAACRPGVFQAFLSASVMVYLGRISYGLYVFHLLAGSVGDVLFAWILRALKLSPTDLWPWLSWICLLGTCLVVTILFASLSYFLYERNFLKLKKRFTAILSRPV